MSSASAEGIAKLLFSPFGVAAMYITVAIILLVITYTSYSNNNAMDDALTKVQDYKVKEDIVKLLDVYKLWWFKISVPLSWLLYLIVLILGLVVISDLNNKSSQQ